MKASFLTLFAVAALLTNAAHAQQVLSSVQLSWLDQQFAEWDRNGRTQPILTNRADKDIKDYFGTGEIFSSDKGSSHHSGKNDDIDEAWERFVAELHRGDDRHDSEKYHGGNFDRWNHDSADCGGTNSGGSSGSGQSQIPEPSTYAMVLGVAAFGFALRRHSRAAFSR